MIGASFDQPVDTITLIFTGEAEPTGTGFQVLDPTGELREPIEATSPDGSTWVLRFDPPLAGGTIGVRWTVRAPDAHPIGGSFSFDVTAAPALPDTALVSGGVPSASAQGGPDADAELTQASPIGSASAAGLEDFLDASEDPTAIPRRLGAAARVVTLFGTLVGVGALIFAAAVLRGERRDVRHVLHWVRRAGVLVVLGATAELIAQIGVEGAGDWSGLASPSTLRAVVASTFGIAIALRLAGGLAVVSGARLNIIPASAAHDPVIAFKELVGAGVGAYGTTEAPADQVRPPGRPVSGVEPYVHDGDHAWFPSTDSAGAMFGAVALMAAPLFDGHTVTKGTRIWTSVADVVHVVGGAVWAGGVLMLAAVLWRRHSEGREVRALQLAVRFSVVATLALAAVGVAGVVLTVVILDAPSELWTTDWGRTLIVKTVFVGLAAAAGAYNHKVLIPQMHQAGDDPTITRRFRTIVTGEAAALAAVLVATALLVGAAS